MKLLSERGINTQGGELIFYIVDENGKVMMAYSSFQLTDNFDKAEVITLRGLLNRRRILRSRR